ncbi:MAG: holo-[acyl-carrier-protein] synthase [Chlorobi bacterium CHB2]|nr:holo-[acyl-carrier-protein] synthase [Chlorobi bacterium CHB2]
MIQGIGIDLTDIHRIDEALAKYGERFERRIFTEEEREYCNGFKVGAAQHFAARFAAKEAFSKAIGTGITQGFKWHEVAIHNRPGGKPELLLTGAMAERYGHLRSHVSLTHTDTTAGAVVVLED